MGIGRQLIYTLFSCKLFLLADDLRRGTDTHTHTHKHVSPHAPLRTHPGNGPKAIGLSAYGLEGRRLFGRSSCTVLKHVCDAAGEEGEGEREKKK